ncbi:MAG: hypothetical protein Q9163_005750, partial [Psora crenata]
GTPNSGISQLSTVAIREGERGKLSHYGHAHTVSSASDSSTNTLDAERADRISRLAGLERVATLRGAHQHIGQGPQQIQPQQQGYFDNASNLYRSTVGSASATGSIGGSVPESGDKMSEEADDGVSSAGLSEDGNASLVGFGETASSTVSAPTSNHGIISSGLGFSASTKQRQQRSERSGSPMEGVDDHSAGLADSPVAGLSAVDTSSRTKVNSYRLAGAGGHEQGEKIFGETMHDTAGRDRTLKGIGVIEASPIYEPLPGFERVTVTDAAVGHVVTILPAQNVFGLGFSPLGTFIITWQRPSRDENGDAVKNLNVWRVAEERPAAGGNEHSVVGRFVQKSATGGNLQYTRDERFCGRIVTNEIQFYESAQLGTVWNKLCVEGVTEFAISPGKEHAVAVFVPERKGLPAAVQVFNMPTFTVPISRKSFFKADKVQLKWNNDGTNLIVLAQTEVDKSGKSYYGETTLYLMSANGGFESRIHLDKEGPIHDVAWSPKSNEFGVVYGYMPAKTTLFNKQANPIHTFSLSPRNTILFSPHGCFLLIAGFGNLAGQMDIYDLGNDRSRICTIEASNASVCEWSPDGRHILTATTSPRLRVDNGVRIWHVRGGLMYNEDLSELYDVTWRPQPTTQHPLSNNLDWAPTPHVSALRYLGTVKTPSKPAAAYRPPGARGQVTPLAFRREDEGGAAYVSNGTVSQGTYISGFGKPRKREVPGAETVAGNAGAAASAGGDDESLSKAAAKNKKKREAKKAKEAAEKVGWVAPVTGQVVSERAPSPGRTSESREGKERERNRSSGKKMNPLKNPSSPQNLAQNERQPCLEQTPRDLSTNSNGLSVTSPGSGGTPHEKKIRALLKKLRAIDDLKMRRAGGEKLEGTQIMKMDTEAAVRKELDDLGWNE